MENNNNSDNNNNNNINNNNNNNNKQENLPFGLGPFAQLTMYVISNVNMHPNNPLVIILMAQLD